MDFRTALGLLYNGERVRLPNMVKAGKDCCVWYDADEDEFQYEFVQNGSHIGTINAFEIKEIASEEWKIVHLIDDEDVRRVIKKDIERILKEAAHV